jgi:AraC-like DNA-binding protein
MFIDDDVTLGGDVTLVVQNENCAVYKMNGETGDGLMTCYQLFPGVILMYNDFHMERCYSKMKPRTDMFCIDHCREGRIEWELDNGNCVYQEAGDLKFDTRENHTRNFNYPLRHFHGLTISFFVEEAPKSLSSALEGFTVDIRDIRKKFCLDGWPYTMTADETLRPLFESLYQVPEAIRLPLSRLKILELLLHLDTLDIEKAGLERPYFHKTLVDKIKAIEQFMTAHPEDRYTQEELADRFTISVTSMKQCFKGVFGSSMYAYMRSWRMNAAAVKLRQTEESITDIAGDLGYDNVSKFSNAFREVMGKNPGEYRKVSV